MHLFLLFLLPLFADVELGIDRFFQEGYAAQLEGKRVGLITNQTGIDSHLQTTVKLFYKYLSALFAPEHGLAGNVYAGLSVQDQQEKEIPVFSLHGKTRRPTEEMLSAVDIIIFDIQDIGTRPYTYASTLFYTMEEAKKRDLPVIVLDRPNPMGGLTVDGPMLEKEFRSFIGYINVPYCHGMTIGELALFFNTEYDIHCKLLVIPMKGWKRTMTFKETGHIWIPTSPNIPESDTPFFSATTGLIGELDLVNIGIGYTLPFKLIGAPWINAETFAKALNEQKIPGATFTPIHYKPFYGSYKTTECHGIQIHITNPAIYRPFVTQCYILGLLKTLYPEEVVTRLKKSSPDKLSLFHKAYGSSSAYTILLNEKYPTWKLLQHQKAEREAFLKTRGPYLLY